MNLSSILCGPCLKLGLIRFGRGLAGIAVAYGLQVAASQVVTLPIPPIYAPLVPMVVGPALNAIAKFAREHVDPDGMAAKVAGSVL